MKYNASSKNKKAQSAMDYLLTYGWAVLAIAVVLIILIKLGIFNITLTGSSCVGSVGFLCTSPIMNSSGYLAATIGSSTESINIIKVGCSNSTAVPSTFAILQNPLYLAPQETATQLFRCPISTSSPIGTPFSGTLWIEYTTSYVPSQIQISEVGAVITKVSGNISISGLTGSPILPSTFMLSIYVVPSNGGSTSPSVSTYTENTGSQVSISATPASGYTFYNWTGSGSGSYSGTSNTALVTMNSNITEVATFLVPNTILFKDPGLPLGTTWGVTFNGITNTTTGNYVLFTENVPGEYPFYIDYTPGYAPLPLNGSIHFVNANVIFVNFSKTYHISPYQQLLSINPSEYTSYESSNLGNLRFYYKSIQAYNTITELNSWCESGCSSSSTNATFFVLTPNDLNITEPNNNISSGSFKLILDFSNTLQYNATAGEAPELSPIYGEYDNGNNVFNYYTNFAGTSLPSGWTSGGGVSYKVNNGITLYPSGTNDGSNPDQCTGGVYIENNYSSNNFIEDIYGNVVGNTPTGTCSTLGFGVAGPSPFPANGTQQNELLGWGPWESSTTPFIGYGSGPNYLNVSYTAGQNRVFTVGRLNCSGSAFLGASINYTKNLTGIQIPSFNNYHPDLYTQSSTSLDLNAQWLAMRSLPPVLPMPVGSVVSSVQQNYIGNYLPINISMHSGITCANITKILINISATSYKLTMSSYSIPSTGASNAPVEGTITPITGYYPKGSTVYIKATPLSNYIFVGWSGSGTGNYTGTNEIANVVMNGNINETAYFAPHMVIFTENTIPANSLWNLTFNGVLLSSTTNTITAFANNGNYFYDPNPTNSIGTASSYIPYNYILPNTILPYNAEVSVNNANVIVYVPYTPVYTVTFINPLNGKSIYVYASLNITLPGGYNFETVGQIPGASISIPGASISVPIFVLPVNSIMKYYLDGFQRGVTDDYPSPASGTLTVSGPTTIDVTYSNYSDTYTNEVLYGLLNITLSPPPKFSCSWDGSVVNVILSPGFTIYKNNQLYSYSATMPGMQDLLPNLYITILLVNTSGSITIIPYNSFNYTANIVSVAVSNNALSIENIPYNLQNTIPEYWITVNNIYPLTQADFEISNNLIMPLGNYTGSGYTGSGGSLPTNGVCSYALSNAILYGANVAYSTLEIPFVPSGTYNYVAVPPPIGSYGVCLPDKKYGSVSVVGNTILDIPYTCWKLPAGNTVLHQVAQAAQPFQ